MEEIDFGLKEEDILDLKKIFKISCCEGGSEGDWG